MKPITYPARPINGGAFDPAVPKPGPWFAEPKYNGWRALVHAPTGTMWNRKGEQLSIAAEFAAALEKLRDNTHVAEWFDCEALDRRHGIARGSLIILDVVLPALPYTERRALLCGSTSPFRESRMRHCHTYLHTIIPNGIDELYHTESYEGSEAPALYAALKQANADLKCEFYEGIVMKQGGSPYPIQRLSPDRETHTWIKHRWAW